MNEPSKSRNVERRMTVASNVYVQMPGADTVEFAEGYTHFIHNDEQPFDRTTSVGREWIRLECGWMKDTQHCSISFANRSNEGGPSLEIRLDEYNVNQLTVSPKGSARFKVKDLSELWIRSSDESVKVRFRYLIVPE